MENDLTEYLQQQEVKRMKEQMEIGEQLSSLHVMVQLMQKNSIPESHSADATAGTVSISIFDLICNKF